MRALLRAPRSLSGRVTLAAVAAVGAALLIAGAGVVLVTARADRGALDRDLERQAERVGGPGPGLPPPAFGEGRRDGPRGDDDDDGDGRGRLDQGQERFTRVVFADGTVTSGGAAVPANFPLPAPQDTPTTVTTARGAQWRTVVRPLPGGGFLQVAADLDPLREREARLRLIVLATLLAALLGTALLTRALARYALRPLERLRGTAGEVADTADLAVRVPSGAGPEEVDALAEDFNAMLARLQATAAGREAALASARRFAADAGHELRTPLTSLQANLSTGAQDAAGRDAERLAALVDQLQQLARGEAGPPARTEDVDLGELADGVVLTAGARHPGVSIALEAPPGGPLVRGEAESLRMLLDNLVENAARHGRPDGRVLVTVAPRAGGGADVLVDDDGPGIPPDEREVVFRRFARGTGASGPGTGLGLPIAAAQAARHGGGIALEDAPLGGLRVRVELPGVGDPGI